MRGQFLTFQKVDFTYDALACRLILGLNVEFPVGWTGIVGANGSGKSTLLKLAAGELQPMNGNVHIPGLAIYCPQRTDDPPNGLMDLLQVQAGDAHQIKYRLALQDDWLTRWNTLSHGERKRAQIAVALWLKPLVLALDEPTNHIDRAARLMLVGALQTYRGVGLLVSHDRELLDSLCRQCLFMEPGAAALRPGNYTQAAAQTEHEDASLRRQRESARRDYQKLKRVAVARKSAASQADTLRSKRHLDKKDHDGRAKIDHARLTGKDAVAGKLLRQIEGRLQRADEKARSLTVRKTFNLGIWIEGSRSARDTLFKLPSSRIPLGGDRTLSFPAITMRPADRIALTGPNGSGKSTFIRHLLRRIDLPAERVISIPQEIDLTATQRIMTEVHRLGHDHLGHVMTVVSCLGSRPGRLLESQEPSPGEMRKILLALGIALKPHLIIMDEPTNHMDLPSIQCLEDALAGCPCGLLLISHDPVFLARLTDIQWAMTMDEGRNSNLIVRP